MSDKQALTKRDSSAISLSEREAQIATNQAQQQRDQANQVLGGLAAISTLNKMIGSQTLRGWQRFFEEEMHMTLGYKDISHFLSEAPQSPMTKSQWYERRIVLETEGDNTFDLLNSIRIPISARKALPPSAFEVRDNMLCVTDDKGQEFEVPLSDTKRVKSIINNIAREHSEAKKKLEQEAKKTEALSNRVKELSDAKPKLSNELATPHGEALLFALTALKNLTDKASDLTDDEAIAQRGNTLELIGVQMTELHAAYRFSLERPGTAAPRKPRKPTDAEIQAALGD